MKSRRIFFNIKEAKITNTETIFVKNVLIYKTISNLLADFQRTVERDKSITPHSRERARIRRRQNQ